MPKILRNALLVFVACCFGAAQGAAPKAVKAHGKHSAHHRGKTGIAVKHPADNSGKTQTGKASYLNRYKYLYYALSCMRVPHG